MKILIGLTIIAIAIAIMLAAALVKAMADKREDARMEQIWREDAWSAVVRAIKERDNIKTEYRAYRTAASKRVNELEKKTVEYVFNGWEFIKPADGCRDYYIEKDGIRIIVEDGKATSGWYAKKFIKEGDSEPPKGTCEPASIPPMTNYRYIHLMSADELADFFDNFEEEFAMTCKYCTLCGSDGTCGPVPEGEDKKAYCNAATLKWLMDIRASAEESEEDV